MSDDWLSEVLKQDELKLLISQEGIETKFYINKLTQTRSISAYGITLCYDYSRFSDDMQSYTLEQSINHQNYNKIFQKLFRDSQGELISLFDVKSDLETLLPFDISDSSRLKIELAKLIMAPNAWKRFGRLDSTLRSFMLREKSRVVAYDAVKSVVDYGMSFLNSTRGQYYEILTDEVLINLSEWEKNQRELTELYSRVNKNVKEKYENEKTIFRLLYPKNEDKL